jgi:hypothetical protein
MARDAILTLLVEIEFSEVDVVESGVVVAPLLGIVFAEAIFDFPLQIDLVLLPVPLHLLQILKQLLLPLRYLSLVGERFQTCKYFTNIFLPGSSCLHYGQRQAFCPSARRNSRTRRGARGRPGRLARGAWARYRPPWARRRRRPREGKECVICLVWSRVCGGALEAILYILAAEVSFGIGQPI